MDSILSSRHQSPGVIGHCDSTLYYHYNLGVFIKVASGVFLALNNTGKDMAKLRFIEWFGKTLLAVIYRIKTRG
jgi:hypothetical protein